MVVATGRYHGTGWFGDTAERMCGTANSRCWSAKPRLMTAATQKWREL
jgi:hypothetical protein